jgi:fibronectin type 3 domain-containing protein
VVHSASLRYPKLTVALATLLALVATLVQLSPASASSVTSASFSGGAGTVTVAGTLYAKNGGALTFTVATSSDTKCVELTGAYSGRQTSSTARSSWTFPLVAGAGDGVRTVTAAASPGFNANNCTGQSKDPGIASFVLDNTGPTVTAALSPAPNAAGWNNANATITWSATDAGAGVASGPTPATDSVTADTGAVTRTASATDRLGNAAGGAVTVKLDKTAPTISGSRMPAANADGWNNTDVTVSFACSDALSGIRSCSGTSTLADDGANQSRVGTAIDNADNSASATVGPVSIDKVPPALSGAPTTSANAAGWYSGDVTVDWACSDALSGIDGSCPANSTISGEGADRTADASVRDKAGNTTGASSPPVSIDKTAPTTSASAPGDWNNDDVTIDLSADDALSGVKATHYRLDGDAQQTGTSISIGAEGVHTLEFWSVDNADNVEAAKTVQVRIDKTPPAINHSQSPAANANGWNHGDVTVTFVCSDAQSGIASCSDPQTVTTEGRDQPVTGTAEDHAGNRTTDPATVSIDKTDPTISAGADRAANADGWYADDVTVGFHCSDTLSGIDRCPASRTLGEGGDQNVSGVATDAAGNAASAGVTGINVDKTAPSLDGAATTAPNGNGWYAGDVTVDWTCSDRLSGLADGCPAASTITGEGGDLSASASIGDKAGNSTTRTVAGIKIDRTAPSTSADVPAPLDSGWYAGAVEVTLSGVDSLSGVEATYYRVDDGAAQTYDGPFRHSLKGSHTITFWSVDRAGNLEDRTADGHSITLKIDGVPPTITTSRSPAPNANGWNNTPVLVGFACDDAESGIAGCVGGGLLENEGAGQSMTGSALDNAGNGSQATVDDVNIDLTPPNLLAAPTTDPNADGWYNADVTVHWLASDGLSGVDTGTQPDDSTITGEGADLGAGPVSVADKAGNTASASLGGVRIDRTPPTVEGAPTTRPNGDGWYSGDVVVDFTCDDNLSGVASCPSSKVISGDGANQSVTSDPATDHAGNSAPGKTVGGINIDGQAPQTKADNLCTSTNGYCTGATATVSLHATDVGPAGVREIRYRVNSGSEQVAAGASVDVNVPLNGSGSATVDYYAVDRAGNQEPRNTVGLKYDNIAPTVTHTLSPTPNAAGWNADDVTVHFSAKDDDAGSGVDPGSITPDVLVGDETGGRVVNGQARDTAGNLGTDSVTVKLDRTPPAISGAVVSGTVGSNGWYTGPVTVHFTCSDALSGVAVCPDDVTLTGNGAGQSRTASAVDNAGNARSATVDHINIDAEAPTIGTLSLKDGGVYTLGAVPAASCAAADGVSGVASCSVRVSGGLANGVGTFAFTATATDKAGNTVTRTGSYRVVYRFDGFLQPINDTAHQVDTNVSIFKAGSTIPAKFQLKRNDGTIVQPTSLPQWVTPAKGSPTTAPVDESSYGDQPSTSASYRWDSTAQQYIYNWGTSSGQKGFYWRLGVQLDDGQTYTVNIGLR